MVSIFFKIITIISEGILAVPVLGGSIIVGLLWIPLIVMLFIHILGLIVANIEGKSTTGHILGIITSILGFIPFLGWFLHCITFIVLLTEIISDSKKKDNDFYPNNNSYKTEVMPKQNHNQNHVNSNYPVIQKSNENRIIEADYEEHKKK